jgi:hypothetical protein
MSKRDAPVSRIACLPVEESALLTVITDRGTCQKPLVDETSSV